MLNHLITNKTRVKLLIKFFVNYSNIGHLNGLAGEFKESTNSIRKELNHFSKAGYIKRSKVGNKIIYKADSNHPFFGVLQKIVRTHLGLEDIVSKIFKNIGEVEHIILTGDYAKGIDSGIIDLIIVGKDINEDYLIQLKVKVEKIIKRKVKFIINNEIPSGEFLLLLK